jgi:hypothetical protein
MHSIWALICLGCDYKCHFFWIESFVYCI